MKFPVAAVMLFCVTVAVLTATPPRDRETVADVKSRILNAYGVKWFDDIEALRYTYNLQSGDRRVERRWMWQPKFRTVAYHGRYRQSKTPIDYEYVRPATLPADTSILTYVDQRFINDNYWFMFPFHIAWDSGLVLSVDGPTMTQEAKNSPRLTVQFTSGGYTPGDSYELFLAPDGLITWWVFHQGGGAEGSMMTWEKPARLGPIIVNLEHKAPDGTRLWFSDVAVRMNGDTTWYHAD